MDSDKDSHEFQNKQMAQNCENRSVTLGSNTDKEESLYNLQYLFKTPSNDNTDDINDNSRKLETKNIRTTNQINKIKEIEKWQECNLKFQVNNCKTNQNENIQPINEHVLCGTKTVTEQTQDTSKSTSDSGSDMFENFGTSSSSGVSNNSIKVEIHNVAIGNETVNDHLNSKSANSMLKLDFEIMPAATPVSDIIEISDDDDDDQNNIPKINNADGSKTDIFKNVSKKVNRKNCQKYIENSRNIQTIKKKLFSNTSRRKASKSFTDFSSRCNTWNPSKISKSFEEFSNHSFKIKIYNMPQTMKSHSKNKLKHKYENCSPIQKMPILPPYTFENNSPKRIPSNSNYPKINLKIYNTSLTQTDKSDKELKELNINSSSHISENLKTEITENSAKKSDKVVSDIFKKDFTQNIIEIGKDMMQSIHGVIFKSFNCCGNDNRLKPKNSIATSNVPENSIMNNSKETASPNLSHNRAQKDRNLKETEKFQNEFEGMKTMQISNESVQTDREQKGGLPTQLSNFAKTTKRLPQSTKINYPSLRQRQLELHHLRVQVELKRLKVLDLKIAREWEEMQREKIMFDKMFSPSRYQFKMSEHSFDV